MSGNGRSRSRVREALSENNADVGIDVSQPNDILSPVFIFKEAARLTSPDLSLVFLAIFIVLAYFHESYSMQTGIVVTVWLLLQLVSYALNPDFRNDMFWNIMSMLGSFLIYLAIGHAWTYVKLYLDIWQGHMPKETTDDMAKCLSLAGAPGCVAQLLFDLKWYITQLTLLWPVSVAYTLTRDPLRIITDLIFDLSRQRYIAVIHSALDALDLTTGNAATPLELLLWVAYLLGYFFIGYALSHVKLFLDTWQGTLPPASDRMVRELYEGGSGNYIPFILSIRWLILEWTIIWPLLVPFTILRHPARIAWEVIYSLSQKKFVWIVRYALQRRFGQKSQ